MTRQLMRRIVDAGQDAGLSVEEYVDYCTDGFTGEKTCAVTANSQAELMVALVLATAGRGHHEVEAMAVEVKGLRFDELGRQILAY